MAAARCSLSELNCWIIGTSCACRFNNFSKCACQSSVLHFLAILYSYGDLRTFSISCKGNKFMRLGEETKISRASIFSRIRTRSLPSFGRFNGLLTIYFGLNNWNLPCLSRFFFGLNESRLRATASALLLEKFNIFSYLCSVSNLRCLSL